MGDVISPCCWLLFLCHSERSRLCRGTSGHTNGSHRQGTALTASACGDRGMVILVPQRYQAHQNNLLWSWTLAHVEKGTGAGTVYFGSAPRHRFNERCAGSCIKQQHVSTKPLSENTLEASYELTHLLSKATWMASVISPSPGG